MYYCLIRDEPEASIVSVHRLMEDAIAERMVKEYEEKLKRELARIEDHYRETVSFIIMEVPDGDAAPHEPFDVRCKRLDAEYAPLLEEAKATKAKNDAAKALKAAVEHEIKTQSQRAEIGTFMAKWETCDPELRPLWLEKIKPVARAYLLSKNDPEVSEWMRTHYIL